MPRSRRYDSASSPSFASDSASSPDDRRRPRPSRNASRRRPPLNRSKDERSFRSLDKGGRASGEWDDWPPRYAEDWSTESGDSRSSSGSEDSDDSQDSRSKLSSSAAPTSSTLSQQQQSRRCIILFVGIAVAVVLVIVGGFALVRSFGADSSSFTSSSGSSATEKEVVTVTVTASDGKVTTKVSTESSSPSKTSSAKDSEETGSLSGGSEDDDSGGGSTGGSGTLPGLSRNNIGIGFLPDYNDQSMKDITDGLGIKSSFYGWYAQLPESGEWDGSQLLSQLDDVKACNCIFQPAVMPTQGWNGLTKDDNSQALAIAKVMKQFTDEGIEVWLRFAHEINWYLSDGTYKGSIDDFKEAWPLVAAAVADNDLVKMFFTPNVAGSLDDYVNVMPDDLSTIHYLGIDYYPKSSSEKFVDHMQELYNKYCSDGSIKFAIGETGTGWEATIEERLAWLADTTSAETAKAMPHHVGVSWFNYNKEQQFKLWIKDDDATNEVSKKWMVDGTVAEGATMGNS
ncbi:hypothetical protein JCM6882_003470 [Rhodosporidiobolus microsporus]